MTHRFARKFPLPVVLSLIVLCVCTCEAAAQSSVGTASLAGTVADATKSVLPGVTVSLRNTETGVVRTAVTNEVGLYRLLAIQPGMYVLAFELSGFSTQQREALRLLVGQNLEIDAVLTLANVAETVTVTGAAPLVEATKSGVASYITQQQIEDLPVNGRTLNDFVALSPGVVSTGISGSGSGTTSQNISVGGTATTQTSLNIDGVFSKDQFYSAPRNNYSQEAVQEFQVVANSFSAEFGRTSGGVVNISLKSGTNTLKGSGFGFFRHSALDTLDSLSKANGLTNPPSYRRQWGGSLGGPVKHDKTFFFVTAERQGYNRTSFTNSDADIARALGLTPESGQLTVVDNNTKLTGKVDHNLRNNSMLVLRYDFFDGVFKDDKQTFGTLGPGLDYPNGFTTRLFRGHTASANWNRMIRSYLMNEFRFRFDYWNDIRQSPQDQPANVRVTNAGSYFYNFRTADFTNRRSLNFIDNFSIFKNKHSIKFGIDYQREFDEWDNQIYRKPEIVFASKAAFFANTPQQISIDFGGTYARNNNNLIGAFVQDQYRITKTVTANIGLRWDGEFYVKQFPYDPDPATKNFAPRVGLAYAPTSRTTYHASGGLFYGQVFGLLLQNIRLGQYRRQYTIDGLTAQILWNRYRNNMDAAVNRPSEAEVLALPGVKPRDISPGTPVPGFGSPYSIQSSVGVEHQFGENIGVDVSYLFVGSRHEAVSRNINLQAPQLFSEGQVMPNGLIAGPNGGFYYDLTKRVDPTYNSVQVFEDRANGTYHGLAVSLRKRIADNYGFGLAYTHSVAKNDGEQFGSTTIPNDIQYDYGYAANHFPSRLALNGVWNIRGPQTALLRDWQLSGIYVYQSGPSRTVTFSSPSGCWGLLGCAARPPQYAEKNAYQEPPYKDLDLRISRFFSAGGQRRLQLAIDVFNVFNYEQFNLLTGFGTYPWRVNADGSIPPKPDFTQPGASASFGRPSAVINGTRVLQLGVRFSF